MVRLEYSEVVAFELANLPVTASRELCHTPPTGIAVGQQTHLPLSTSDSLSLLKVSLGAKELTACLPSISTTFQVFPSLLHFYSFCLFSLEPLAVFFQPVSSCSFLAISLTPGDFVHSCYPWPGCHSTDLWKRSVLDSPVGVTSSAAEGSWLFIVDSGSSILPDSSCSSRP